MTFRARTWTGPEIEAGTEPELAERTLAAGPATRLWDVQRDGATAGYMVGGVLVEREQGPLAELGNDFPCCVRDAEPELEG